MFNQCIKRNFRFRLANPKRTKLLDTHKLISTTILIANSLNAVITRTTFLV
jgi:hypothetical protein